MASRVATALVLFIVAATLIAGLIAGAQNDLNGPVDLIVLNGRVYTADGRGTIEEALAVRGNQILRVGSNREIRRLARAQTTIVDAGGGSVTPGFVESNANLPQAGLAARRLDLTGIGSAEVILRSIRAFAELHPEMAWIEGRGWDPAEFEKLPTRETLDAIVADRPVSILSADERTMWVNSKALDAARITRRTTATPDGAIVRDRATGEPSGILKDAATRLVSSVVPAPGLDERVRAIEAAVALAHRAGITSVHNAPASVEDLQAFARLRRSGEMRLRIYQLLEGSAPFERTALAALDRVRAEYPEVPLFKIGAVRLAGADATADPAALAASLAQLDASGYSVVVNADDPAALATIVEAFGQVRGVPSFASRRHRVELGASLDPSDPDVEAATTRLARSGVAVSTVFSYPLDPLASIAAQIQPVDAKYSVRLRQALDRATSVAARASFDEQRKGTLAAGMLADFVILSANLFAAPPVDLSTVTVDMTVFDGKIVHDRRALSQTTR